jgi:hypothetical protein
MRAVHGSGRNRWLRVESFAPCGNGQGFVFHFRVSGSLSSKVTGTLAGSEFLALAGLLKDWGPIWYNETTRRFATAPAVQALASEGEKIKPMPRAWRKLLRGGAA